MKWEVLFPPDYDDVVHLDSPLPGTHKFATGKGSARKTLQVIGGRPTKDVDVDLGWAEVHITSREGILKMDFKGGKAAAEERWEGERAEEAIEESIEEIIQKAPRGNGVKELPPA